MIKLNVASKVRTVVIARTLIVILIVSVVIAIGLISAMALTRMFCLNFIGVAYGIP